MAITSGVFNASQNPSELNARSFAASILRRFPNGTAPIFGLTSKAGRTKAKSATHGYFSKTMSFMTLVSNAAAVGATTLVVPSTVGITQFMVLHNTRTRENVRVSAVPNGTDITIERAFGRVPAAAINANDYWIQAGTAFPEGSNRPVARRMTTVYVPNYTQIFRNAWALTDTARASMAEQGYENVGENRTDCMTLHSTDIESAIVFGQPKMDTSGPAPIHTTQGIIDAVSQYAPTHVNAAGATTNYSQLMALMDFAFESTANIGDPGSRLLLGDATAIRVIADIGRKSGQVNINPEKSSFGHRYTSFQFQRGQLDMMEHPLLNGLGLNGMALVLDMSAIKLAYMEGRDTKKEDYNTGGNLSENGVDAVGGSLTTEFAVELVNPYACAVITGLVSGVAD